MPRDKRGQTRATGPRSIRGTFERKPTQYQGLAGALRAKFSGPGLKVPVLAWVVGTQAVLDVDGIRKAMAFMDGDPDL